MESREGIGDRAGMPRVGRAVCSPYISVSPEGTQQPKLHPTTSLQGGLGMFQEGSRDTKISPENSTQG